MEDYILDHWDKWTHNKIRSIAEEILLAIRDIHAVRVREKREGERGEAEREREKRRW
jgi:hypothetical protein